MLSKHLQGPQLGHVVEAGHRQPSDVVVVESTMKREIQSESGTREENEKGEREGERER